MNVANDQRTIIYDQRNELMATDDISETVNAVREEVVANKFSEFVPPQSLEEQWDIPGLEKSLENDFAVKAPIQEWLDQDDSLHEESLYQKVQDTVLEVYKQKEAQVGEPTMRNFEKQVMLQVLDTLWKEHLQTMDHLRQGIHLRGYAQKNPKQEYKRESFHLFQELLESIKRDVIRILCHVQVQQPEDVEAIEQQRREQAERQQMDFKHAESTAMAGEESDAPEQSEQPETFVRDGRKVGRNEPCPCGSGKKYKQCHGKLS